MVNTKNYSQIYFSIDSILEVYPIHVNIFSFLDFYIQDFYMKKI